MNKRINNLNLCLGLKELREQAGVSQEYIRNRIGMRKSSYSSLENGGLILSAEIMLKILDVYGIDYNVFEKNYVLSEVENE